MTKYDWSFILYTFLSLFFFIMEQTDTIFFLTGLQVVYFLSELANEKVK